MKRSEIGNLLRWIGWGDTAKDACASWTHLLSLYADSQTTPRQAQRVEAHLAVCAHCRASLALLRATTQIAQTWAETELPPGLSERLQLAIAEEARKQRVAALDVARSKRRFGLPQIAISGTGLAAVLLGIYAFDHHRLPHPTHMVSVAVNPVRSALPGAGVTHGMKPTAVAALPKPRHARVPVNIPKKTVVAMLPREEQPQIMEGPIVETPTDAAPPTPHSVHPSAAHPLLVANAASRPRLKPHGTAIEKIAKAIKPPVSVPSEMNSSDDDDDTTPTPPAAVVASVPKPVTPDTPVVTLASTIKSLARSTQHIEPGTDQISVTAVRTANYTGAATIVGSEIH